MLFKDFLFKKENTITFVARKETHDLLHSMIDVLTCYEWPKISCYLPDDPTTYSYERAPEEIAKLNMDYGPLERQYFKFAFRRTSSLWHLTEEETQLFKKCLFTVHSFLDTIPYLVVTPQQRAMMAETLKFLGVAEEPA